MCLILINHPQKKATKTLAIIIFKEAIGCKLAIHNIIVEEHAEEDHIRINV